MRSIHRGSEALSSAPGGASPCPRRLAPGASAAAKGSAPGSALDAMPRVAVPGAPPHAGAPGHVDGFWGAFIGMIIGRGGESVKAMSRSSGAQIEVSKVEAGSVSWPLTARRSRSWPAQGLASRRSHS